ncbi:hypothetical protein B296_00028465 [Ensete ventricosum]|uniref:Uncharacterized protein n=1 Tax=Ensete ventricosum TaxID=4639 RepID=A0A426YLY8_ENSVE|nr:hypothetical protein B296_00028465 [Ensete ventricosum]
MGQPSSSSPTPSQQSVTAPRSHDDPTSAGSGRGHIALTWLSWHRRLRRDPINEEWRITSLHHAEGTDSDRPHLPTMPGLTIKDPTGASKQEHLKMHIRPRASRDVHLRPNGPLFNFLASSPPTGTSLLHNLIPIADCNIHSLKGVDLIVLLL